MKLALVGTGHEPDSQLSESANDRRLTVRSVEARRIRAPGLSDGARTVNLAGGPYIVAFELRSHGPSARATTRARPFGIFMTDCCPAASPVEQLG